MIFDILSGLLVDPLLPDEASQLNETFHKEQCEFQNTVKTIIHDSTISSTTWAFLDEEVKNELTRLGYKHEE